MARSAQSWEVMVMVVMLVCHWTDGQVVSKCQLRSRLQKAFLRHPSDVIAKMVCTVEHISIFNTSLVTNNNNVPPGSFIRPQYIEGENPSFPPEVVKDGLIPIGTSQAPAVTSVQDKSGEEESSGDEPPTGNGSGESSDSKSEGKGEGGSGEESGESGSGEESGEDGSGESSGSQSEGKREVDSGEESGEDGSEHDFSGEESGSGTEGPTDMPPITGSLITDDPFESGSGSGEPTEPITGSLVTDDPFEPVSGSGEPTEPITGWLTTNGPFSPVSDSGRALEPITGTLTTNGPFEPVSGSGAPLEPITGTLITSSPFSPVSDSGRALEPITRSLITNGPFEPVSGSGAPLEPISAITEWDSTENDFFPDTDEGPVGQTRYPGGAFWKALFQRDLPNATPTLATTNTEPTEGSADMPTDYDYLTSNPTTPQLGRRSEPIHFDTYEDLFGHSNNGPFDGYEQNSSPSNLYGIFQLGDDVACQSEGRYSPNVCNLYCQDLTDSDITDDIACLMTLKKQGMEVIVSKHCQTVEASEYFADCE